MILDAALNHALHVGIVRFPVGGAIIRPLVQALRPFLGALSLSALSSALFDAHPRKASRSVSSCRGPRMISPLPRSSILPAKLTSAAHHCQSKVRDDASCEPELRNRVHYVLL